MAALGLLRKAWPEHRRQHPSSDLDQLASVIPMPIHQPRRPDPTLRFTDPHGVPGGAFAAHAIANDALRPAAIPGRGAPWEAVEEFALSYDGYGYWNGLAELAGRSVQEWTRYRSLPETLDELRACLFYEQRRWHHFGQEPYGRAADYLAALLGAITDRVRELEAKRSAGEPAARAG